MSRIRPNPPVLTTSLLLAGSLLNSFQVQGAPDFHSEIQPVLREYCLGCHSTEKHKGDLDLERFTSLSEAKKQPKVWQGLIEQVSLGEMPPKSKPQLTNEQREQLLSWADHTLDEIALAHAGDPGPVVLRRLSNSEYTYTIRDLTGVNSLDPAKEFPADSASGEGFMNVGQSLVMSPAMLTKYLDAAKSVASHAVLLPDGIRFSPNTSQRDWTEECLTAIRSFYAKFTVNGGGSAVNLQGIKFDTKDGGVLPLKDYITATLEEREHLRGGSVTLEEIARDRNLNFKYLRQLWTTVNNSDSSLVLDMIRSEWRRSTPANAAAIVDQIQQWQQSLWRFTTVGHIGKRDGPKAWQVPAIPLANSREIRFKIPSSTNEESSVIYLVCSDAGDGNTNDFAIWTNPRLVSPGRKDLPLRNVQAAVRTYQNYRKDFVASITRCLNIAAELPENADDAAISNLAKEAGVAEPVLRAWLDCLGIGGSPAQISGHLTQTMESAQGHDFIKGWTGPDSLGVFANSSSESVRIPGTMKPHSIAVHPSPTRRVVIGWRCPESNTMRIEGSIQHAHPECGNGVTWSLEVRRGQSRQRLASGFSQGSKEVKFGPISGLALESGDIVSLAIGPRDGNHSCDLTAVALKLQNSANQVWDLAQEISPNILANNPAVDRFGHTEVWHFYSEPDNNSPLELVLPSGSFLAKWQSTAGLEEKQRLAGEVQRLLRLGPIGLPKEHPNAVLYRQLTSLNGPLINSLLQRTDSSSQNKTASNASALEWGLSPSLFGQHPLGASTVDANSLCVHAPSVLEIRLPRDLADGCEFVVTAQLHETGAEGSVQMQVLSSKPGKLNLAVSTARESTGKSTWSDGEQPITFDSPIIVREGSTSRKRIEQAFDQFRNLFPAALCYTKIVPVDEVVTLTLFYREDDRLKRLMLDDSQSAELDRLWDQLHFVSYDALKLVDAFEQLWQFATQDADPSAFEPLREPIKQRADLFRKLLSDTQPVHLHALLSFAEDAYRRPLTLSETEELQQLYRKLRSEGISHEEAIRLGLARVLVAPAFLYRAEQSPASNRPGPVSGWELATRLSFFLWSSPPDAALRAAAAGGQLQNPEILVGEAKRMLHDPRVRRLATEFACVWLHIYAFDELSEKSERHFPTFNGLRNSMYEETIRFFTDLFQRDGSVLDILDADYTFLNQDLARHYGISDERFQSCPSAADLSDCTKDDWRKMQGIKQLGRGGILAQASTLAKQSGASRTSPILRGNWVSEVLLGEKLPRPPKDVPRLPEDEATETLTVRQLTEKHSSDPRCVSCHRRIDGYGFTLEAFDTIGRLRDRDLGGRSIDTKAKVLDGTELEGVEGLRNYLLQQRRETFLTQVCRKLLGYALGRATLLSDKPLIAEMCQQLKAHEYRISAALETIVRSQQFREIRGHDQLQED